MKKSAKKFILGKKKVMSQIFDDLGIVTPATVVSIGPVVITQIKTKALDGYNAVQVGFGSRKEKNVNKAQVGHFAGKGPFASLVEFRVDSTEGYKVGDVINPDSFAEGEVITVSAISKGKGFQGVVKRHGFKGGPRSHGQKHSEREPGSIGGGLRNKVPKGMRMAGRMGGDRITVKNLKVLKIDLENGEMYISGAIPGRKGTLIEVKA